jgi:hypothetical protein
VRAVLKQPGGHPAAREPPAKRIRVPAGGDDDAVILQAYVNLVAGMQLHLIADRFRDHDLPFLSNLASHTYQV